MNYLKLQTDLMKAANARDGWKHKNFDVPYFEANDRVWVCPEGYWMMGIPKYQFYLDIEKIWKDALPFKGEQFLKDADYTDYADDTRSSHQVEINGVKMNLHKFMVKSEEVFIKEEHLKYFEPDAVFKGTGHKKPLFVYELNELVGMILPVNKR